MGQSRFIILFVLLFVGIQLSYSLESRSLADIPEVNGSCFRQIGPNGEVLPCPGQEQAPTQQPTAPTKPKTTTPTQPEVKTTEDEYYDEYSEQLYENRLYKEFKYMIADRELTPEEYEVYKNADERLGQLESDFNACLDANSVIWQACFSGSLTPGHPNFGRGESCNNEGIRVADECTRIYEEGQDEVSQYVDQALESLENRKGKQEEPEPEDELAKFQRMYGTANLLRDGNNWHLEGCSGCLLQGDRVLTSDREHIWFNGAGLSTGGKASIRIIQDDAEKQIISYESGTVHFRYGKSEKKYEVQARGVKIGITGTEFLLTEQGNSTLLLLKQGSLDLETSEGKKVMTAGQQAVISEGKAVISTADPAALEEAMKPFIIKDSAKQILLWICLLLFISPLSINIFFSIKKDKLKHNPKIRHYGIISFVSSLLGLLFALFAPIGWFFSLVAINFSTIQKKVNPTGLAKAGMIIGFIGAIISGIILIPLFIYLFIP